jgi:hypothetical protein
VGLINQNRFQGGKKSETAKTKDGDSKGPEDVGTISVNSSQLVNDTSGVDYGEEEEKE